MSAASAAWPAGAVDDPERDLLAAEQHPLGEREQVGCGACADSVALRQSHLIFTVSLVERELRARVQLARLRIPPPCRGR